MAKLKVRLKAHRHIYIHNDIGNAAFYFKSRVDERAAKGDREGIGLENHGQLDAARLRN